MGLSDQSLLDAHVHVWDPSVLDYPWLAREPQLNRRFDLASPSAPRGRVILVEAGARRGVGNDELGLLQAVAEAYPDRVAGIIGPIATRPPGGPELRGRQPSRLVGVRATVVDSASARTAHDWAVAASAPERLPLDLLVRPAGWPDIPSLCDGRPRSIVIDHLGGPPMRDGWGSESVRAWLAFLGLIAQYENVFVKLSGLAPLADRRRGLASQVEPYLAVAFDLFGSRRCVWGSDWPVSGHAAGGVSPAEWASVVLDRSALSADEALDVGAANAERLYSIGRKVTP